MSFRSSTSDSSYVPALVAAIALLLVLFGLSAAAIFGVRWLTAPAKGKLAAREQINSGSSRISGYNHFFDLCASVQTLEAQIAAQREQLTTASSADERDRIHANIAGISGSRADAVNQYNADATKSYTLGQFRSSHLPYQLSIENKETTCSA